jgi:GDPmannose 4,6-dehydratase
MTKERKYTMTNRIALITGITGQDASYLSELLLNKDYKVYGIKRRSSTDTTWRISHLFNNPNFEVMEGDITDMSSVTSIVSKIKPDELYNLAAMSHVYTSFEQPAYTFNVNAKGPLYLLESIRHFSPATKFYQASTSELFGNNYDVDETGKKYQDENTKLSANSPYSLAKLTAHYLVELYHKSYGIYACAGILHNHESPRRGEEFVTRKITQWIGNFVKWRNKCSNGGILVASYSKDWLVFDKEEIYLAGRLNKEQGFQFPRLRLGNLNAYRDWGHSKDYVEAMYLMMQQEKPDIFVISTDKAHSVKDFCKLAFSHININNWEDYIIIDPKFYRPLEVDYLCGRSTKARETLKWEPKISFEELVKEMVDSDIERANNG